MRNFRFAVVAGAFLVCPEMLPADEVSAARELIGTVFHWEAGGTPYALVLVSENTAWFISEGLRFRTISTGEPWRVEGRNRLVWSQMRFRPVEINISGSRFLMNEPGLPPAIEGRVSRLKK